MSKINNSSLVNECLIDNNCTEKKFLDDKCKQEEFIDHFLANKGYNKEYSNLCSCNYDTNNYNNYSIEDDTNVNEGQDTINGVLYKKMCKKLGFEENFYSGSDYLNCINAAKQAYTNDLRDAYTAKQCIDYYYPCKNAVISEKCIESHKKSENIIQICSNVIDSNTQGNINSEQNISCTQAINDSCGGQCKIKPPEQKKKTYKCSGSPDYKCSQVDSGKGDYDTLEQCNSSCVNPSPPSASLIYKCSGSPDYMCSQVDSGKGDYDTLLQCNSSCVNPSPSSDDGLSTLEIVGIVFIIILFVGLALKKFFTKIEASPSILPTVSTP